MYLSQGKEQSLFRASIKARKTAISPLNPVRSTVCIKPLWQAEHGNSGVCEIDTLYNAGNSRFAPNFAEHIPLFLFLRKTVIKELWNNTLRIRTNENYILLNYCMFKKEILSH
jgi:hypothetical protein